MSGDNQVTMSQKPADTSLEPMPKSGYLSGHSAWLARIGLSMLST